MAAAAAAAASTTTRKFPCIGVPQDKLKVVLLSCGSFNPPTNLHMRMFELIRDTCVRLKQWDITEGIMSPVSSGYSKKGLLSEVHRIEMCRLATKTSNWIKVDDWESTRPAWTPTVQVLRHFDAKLNEGQIGADRVHIKLICGGDLLESFNSGAWAEEDIEEIVGRFGIICMERAGTDPRDFIYQSNLLSAYEDNILIVKEFCSNEISSTKVRRALFRNQSVRYLVPDDVISYMTSNHLYTNFDNAN